MRKPKFLRLFLFMKICAAAAVLFFLTYFLLDMALAVGLNSMEKQYEGDLNRYKSSSIWNARRSDLSSMIELERAVKNSGFTIRNVDTVEKGRGFDSFSSLVHQFLETTLETPDDLVEPPEERLLEYLRLMNDDAVAIRNVLLSVMDPIWSGDNAGEIDQLKVNRLGEWLAAESLRAASEGNYEDAALFAEALRRLSISLLGDRTQTSWLTAVSLGQTYSGVARKIGGKYTGIELPEITPYMESLQGTILSRMERLIRGAEKMEKVHHFKVYRRELIVWRTYGRLWYRYSLMKEIRARHFDYVSSLDFISCEKISPVRTGKMKRSFWMMNGGEFRIEDMRFRLQKLAFSFEFTRWVLSGKDSPEEGLLDCSSVKKWTMEESGKRTIGYKMPFETSKRDGAIDLPTSFTYPEQFPDK